RLGALEQAAGTIEQRAPERLTAELARLKKAVAELAAGVQIDEQRLAVEVALMADRVDITEELVRLRTHLAACRTALASDGAVGKQLGFLAQELLREVNTLGSKANHARKAQTVTAMNGELEQLRRPRTESEAELSQRIDIATREVETARREIGDVYDRVLVNDDLETAVREVIDLVQSGERGVAQRAPGDMASLLSDFVRQLTREAAQLKQSTGRSR